MTTTKNNGGRMETLELETIQIQFPKQLFNHNNQEILKRKFLEMAVLEAYKNDEISLMRGAYILFDGDYQSMADFLIANNLPTIKRHSPEIEKILRKNAKELLEELAMEGNK